MKVRAQWWVGVANRLTYLKRLSNVSAAILQNWDVAEAAMEGSLNAAGSAMEENSRYLESIDGKTKQLTASWQEFSNALLDNELVKGGLDVIRTIVDGINSINRETDNVLSKISDVVVALGGIHVLITVIKAASNKIKVAAGLTAYSTKIKSLTIALFGLTKEFKNAELAETSFATILAQTGLSLPGLIGILAALAAAVTAVAIGYKKWKEAHPSTDDLIDSAEQAKLEIESLKTQLEDLKAKIDAINGLENPTLADEKDLEQLKRENEELERRLRILEREKELTDKATEESILADIEKAETNPTQEELRKAGERGTYLSTNENAATIAHLEERIEKVNQLTKELSDAEAAQEKAAQASKDFEKVQALWDTKTNKPMQGYWSELEKFEKKYEGYLSGEKNYGDEINEKYAAAAAKVDELTDSLQSAQSEAGKMNGALSDQYGELSKLTNISDKSKKKLDEYSIASIKYARSIGAVDTKQDIRSVFNLYQFDELRVKFDELRASGQLTAEVLVNMANAGDSNGLIQLLNILKDLGVVEFDTTINGMQELLNILYDFEEAPKPDVGIPYETADSLKAISSALKSAMSDYKTYRNLTSETISALEKTIPEILDFLYDEEGKLTEVGIAALQYADDFKEAGDATKYLQKVAAQTNLKKVISELKNEGVAWDDNTERMKRNIKVRMAFYSAEATTLRNDYMAKYGNDALGHRLAMAEPDLKAKIANVTALQNALNEIADYEKTGLSDWVPTGGRTGSSGSGSKTDANKKEAEDERKKLKHRLEMEEITLKEYYEGLTKIRAKYYSEAKEAEMKSLLGEDAVDYSEERLDIDEELFAGRLSILEDYINDNNRLAEKFANVGNIEAEEEIYETTLSHINEAIEQALKEGYDENGEFVQKLRDLYKDAAEKITQTMMDAWSDYESYMDNFNLWNNSAFTKNSFYESWLKQIDAKRAAGGYDGRDIDYINDYNNVAQKLADNTRESINTIISTVIDLIEKEADEYADALDDQIDKLSDIINLKKKLLQETKNQLDHEEDVAEKTREIAKLQSRINQLSLDDSREAAAKRAELEEELYTKTRDLERSQREFGYEQTSQALDDALDLQEKNAEALKKVKDSEIDTWQKKYDKAIKMIDEDWAGTYSKIIDYSKEFSNSIDGQDSIKTACDNVTEAIKEWGVQLKNVEGIYKNVGETLGKAPSIASVGADGSVNLTGTSNLPASKNPYKAEVENLLKQMEANSKEWHKSDAEGRKTLAQRNQQIGKNELPRYGIVPTYDDGDWKLGNELLYDWARKNGYVFHKGGVVGANGKFGEEVMAVVKTGELVLTEEQQRNLAKVLSGPNQALMSILGSYTMRPGKLADAGGNTFAPAIDVTINHNGTLTDSDARRYGDTVANTALEKLREAFVKRGKS